MSIFSGAFNSTALGGGARSVRVLLASAVFSVAAGTEAAPLRITPATVDVHSHGRIVAPYAVANRPATAAIYPLASLDRTRPWDMFEATLTGETVSQALAFADRAGVSLLPIRAQMDRVESIVHTTFSNLQSRCVFDPVDPTVYRHGLVSLESAFLVEGEALRIRQGNGADFIIASDAVAAAVRWGAGSSTILPDLSLQVEESLNGVQGGRSTLVSRCVWEGHGIRLAGGQIHGLTYGALLSEAEPGRGAAVIPLDIRASLYGSWWRTTQETGRFRAHARLLNHPFRVHAARCDMAQGTALITAQWSRIVEPRERIVMATATGRAEPTRRTHTTWSPYVDSWMEEDGRIALQGMVLAPVKVTLSVAERLALRGTGELLAQARFTPVGTRIVLPQTSLYGIGSVLRSRASVNITNAAPKSRQMYVTFEDRVMTVPYENRTMVVS